MQQSFHPGPGHPGLPLPHGQPMGMPGVPHAPGQMMPHMQMPMGGPNNAHMGQGGPMMVNMHPGSGLNGPGGNAAHALSHLQPQTPMFRPPQMGVPGMPQNPMAGQQALLARNRVMMGGQQPHNNMMMNMQNMQNMQQNGMTPAVMAQYQQRLQQQQQQNGLPNGLQFNLNMNPNLADMHRTMQARMGQQQQQNLMHNIAMQHAASQQNPGSQNHAPQMRPQSSMQGIRPAGMPDGPQLPQQVPSAQPPNQPMQHPGTPQQAQRVQSQAGQQPPPTQPHQTPIQAPAPAPNRQATATPQHSVQQNVQTQQQNMQQNSQQNIQPQQAMTTSQAAQKQAVQQQEQQQQATPTQQQQNNQQHAAAASAATTAQGIQNQQQLMQQAQQHSAAQQQQNAMQQEKLRQGQVMMQQQRMASVMSQSAVSKLAHFTDRLGMFSTVPRQDLKDVYRFWQHLVQEFFAEEGVFRLTLIDKQSGQGESRVFEISTALLARFFLEQNKAGVERILIGVNGALENKMTNNTHFLNSKRSTFTFIYRGGIQVVWTGVLKAGLGPENKFTFFDFSPEAPHEEYLSRSMVEKLLSPESPIAMKTSPSMTKGKAKQQKNQQPTLANLPESLVGGFGVGGTVQQFLEMARTMSFFREIIDGSIQNVDLKPKVVLDRINERTNEQLMNPKPQQQFQMNQQMGQGPQGAMMRAPAVNGLNNNQNQFSSSPAHMSLNLPAGRTMNTNSPHMVHENSNQGSMPPPGAVPMTAQRSTQGNSSSTAASVNASPNASGKRRRASTVNKGGDNHDGGDGEVQPKVKPSPKVANKRQKGSAA